jgi:nucleoside 2-deoxyribosyltransferase
MYKEKRKRMIFPWRMKMASTYYLSGPMASYKDFNFPEFKRVTNLLRLEGMNIVSPHEMPQDKKPFLEDHLRADLMEMLNKCDGIILLPGWPTSKGARVELGLALDLAFTVYTFNGYQLFDVNDTRKEMDKP